jgi:hypothetical protein
MPAPCTGDGHFFIGEAAAAGPCRHRDAWITAWPSVVRSVKGKAGRVRRRLPVTPVRLSVTRLRPSRGVGSRATARPKVSAGAPAGQGIMGLTGLLGQGASACAAAGRSGSSAASGGTSSSRRQSNKQRPGATIGDMLGPQPGRSAQPQLAAEMLQGAPAGNAAVQRVRVEAANAAIPAKPERGWVVSAFGAVMLCPFKGNELRDECRPVAISKGAGPFGLTFRWRWRWVLRTMFRPGRSLDLDPSGLAARSGAASAVPRVVLAGRGIPNGRADGRTGAFEWTR